MAAVAQQALEPGRSCGVEMIRDVPNPADHQRGQGVVDHRLVIDRHQLLADGLGDGIQPGAASTGEYDAFHALKFRLQARKGKDCARESRNPSTQARTRHAGPQPVGLQKPPVRAPSCRLLPTACRPASSLNRKAVPAMSASMKSNNWVSSFGHRCPILPWRARSKTHVPEHQAVLILGKTGDGIGFNGGLLCAKPGVTTSRGQAFGPRTQSQGWRSAKPRQHIGGALPKAIGPRGHPAAGTATPPNLGCTWHRCCRCACLWQPSSWILAHLWWCGPRLDLSHQTACHSGHSTAEVGRNRPHKPTAIGRRSMMQGHPTRRGPVQQPVSANPAHVQSGHFTTSE